MPRPPIPLVQGWANKSYVNDIWNSVLPPRRKRLAMLMLLWDAGPGETRDRIAELLCISRRQLSRWVAAYNEGGVQGLLYPKRRRAGRKRKINGVDFNEKLLPLLTENGVRKSTWSLTDIQQQLAEQHQIQVSIGTLRLSLRRNGYSPERRQAKAPNQSSWNKPWPQEYGASLAAYLRSNGQGNPHGIEI